MKQFKKIYPKRKGGYSSGEEGNVVDCSYFIFEI